MRIPHLVAGAWLLAGALSACGGGAPANGAAAPPAAPPGAWTQWLQAHAHALRSSDPRDEDFSDLEFLAAAIGDRRLLQLGESGHGVAEFDGVKARLVRFLHQRLGFDVIAFESGLFECFHADEQLPSLTADQAMRRSIFGVWHADETLPLFEYLKEARSSSRPLTLAGFDTQFSSTSAAAERPAEFRELLAPLDGEWARQAFELDQELVRIASQGRSGARATLRTDAERLIAGYERLADQIAGSQRSLERAFPSRPLWPGLMRRAAEAAPSYIRALRSENDGEYSTIRDLAMADNVSYLLGELYPDRKIVVWAHNFHVQHAGVQNMGSYLVARHRPALYTVGLYMGRGTAAQNDRTVYTVPPPPVSSLEALFSSLGQQLAFADLLGAQRSEGTAWMFEPIVAREWGVNQMRIVPRDQFDAILFVDRVQPPHYR